MHKLIGRLAILTALMLVIAACGGGETGEDAPPDTTTPPADTTAPPATSTTTESTSDGETPSTAEDGDAWEAVEDAAREEGQLVVYTAVQDSINIPLFEAFNEAYPEIEVVHTRLPMSDLTPRYSSERESGAVSADLLVMSDDVLVRNEPDWFASLAMDELPALAEFTDRYIHEKFISFMAGPFVLTYNTELLQTPPESWADLLDPEYKDIGGMLVDPRTSPVFGAVWAGWHDRLGDEFVEGIADQGISYYDSSAAAQQLIAAGDGAFAGPGQAAHSLELRDAGAPLAFLYPDPVFALFHNVAIADNAGNPNAARVYANWLLTPDGLAAACGGQYAHLGPYDDVEDCDAAPTDMSPVDLDLGAESLDEIVEMLGLDD